MASMTFVCVDDGSTKSEETCTVASMHYPAIVTASPDKYNSWPGLHQLRKAAHEHLLGTEIVAAWPNFTARFQTLETATAGRIRIELEAEESMTKHYLTPQLISRINKTALYNARRELVENRSAELGLISDRTRHLCQAYRPSPTGLAFQLPCLLCQLTSGSPSNHHLRRRRDHAQHNALDSELKRVTTSWTFANNGSNPHTCAEIVAILWGCARLVALL